MRKKERSRPAKDFIHLWAKKYQDVTDLPYIINYSKEGVLWKKLQESLKDREIIKLINFVFSANPFFSHLKESGYPIELFMNQINQIRIAAKRPDLLLPEKELELDVPYWNDSRLSFLCSSIRRDDLESILIHITNEYTWTLLFAKMRRQHAKVPKDTRRLFKLWKESRT